MTDALRMKSAKKKIHMLVLYLLLILIAFISAGPFLWLLLTSFKSGQNIYTTSVFTANPTLSNYIDVMGFMNLPKYISNTVVITAAAILVDILTAALCAYPLACMRFPGRDLIFKLLIATMILPAAAGLVIKYITVIHLGLLNTFAGVVLPSSIKVFSIVLLRQAYLTIPHEMIDAAKIDGASELHIWARIMLPEVRPAVTTIAIFDFISHWNDFLWPIIVLQDPQKYPLATALQYLNGQLSYKFGNIAAGTVISIIPVILFFLAFQKNYIEAVAGSVKG